MSDDINYIEYKEKVVWKLGGYPVTYLIPTRREPLPADARCKFCGSRDLVRYGRYRGVQRYLCRDCGRKGADNDALPNMKVPPKVIGTALSMYYEGMSFGAIGRQLWQLFHIKPSKSTLYGWVVKYSKVAEKLVSDIKPKTSKTWVVDETALKVGGKKNGKITWFWDIIDEKSRYLIASRLSVTRGTKDAEAVMKRAQSKVRKPPEFIISDKLASYLDGIERVFGADTWHLQSQGFTGRINTNLVERFHGTLKSRTKVMRGMKNRETAKIILSGYLIYYNFLRPHQALKDKTPAEVAGIKFPYTSWDGIVRAGHEEA